MKHIIVMLSVLICILGCASATSGKHKKKDYYSQALEHIKTHEKTKEFAYEVTGDSSSIIAVEDSVICLDEVLFVREIIKVKHGATRENLPQQDYDTLLKREYITALRKCKDFQRYSLPELQKLNSTFSDSAAFTVYFSEIKEQLLMAKLVASYTNGRRTLPNAADESIAYLFVCKDKKVEEVSVVKLVR